MVSAYGGLLLALPIILYQLYAFVLPAFSPTERKIAFPLLLMVPVLFICGVVFCYFVVLEPATEFLLGFNDDEFTTAVRARDYYSFVALTTIAMGLLFQVPVVILALTRLGITTPEALRRNRRFAILGCAILAGTTRDWILRWAASVGLRPDEGWLTARDLAEADEAFLSSSVAGILPVTRFAGDPIGEGRPGPWTLRARADRESFITGEAVAT
jgi:hypothetical protein